MALSLIPNQLPEQRMHTLSIEEVLSVGENIAKQQPPLENYFSPSRKEKFLKDYIHYLNTSLIEIKHGNLDLSMYLMFVLTFQFVAPLLKISIEKELGLFFHLLEKRYEVDDLDINIHFTTDELEEGMLGEKDALEAFRRELDFSYEGRREVKETVQRRLKQDGIEAIMKWQQFKGIPELAEAFGRSIVIPSFFFYKDKKLIDFYEQNSRGITYEVAVPEFEDHRD